MQMQSLVTGTAYGALEIGITGMIRTAQKVLLHRRTRQSEICHDPLGEADASGSKVSHFGAHAPYMHFSLSLTVLF